MNTNRMIIAGVLALAGMSVCADTGAIASFAVGAGEVQSVTDGKKSPPPTLDGFTKTGEGTILFDGPARVTGVGDVQAGTLKIAKLFSEDGTSPNEMMADMPTFTRLSFAPGTCLDLSDNAGFPLQDLVGAPTVTNSGVFGVTGKWTLTAPGEVLTVKGDKAEIFGDSLAGHLAFAEGAEFDFKDAATEEAFTKAVAAAGSDGLVVARAYWVYPEDATLGDVSLAMPKPSSTASKDWSMRVNGDNTAISLFLASRGPLTGFAALAAENLPGGEKGK